MKHLSRIGSAFKDFSLNFNFNLSRSLSLGLGVSMSLVLGASSLTAKEIELKDASGALVKGEPVVVDGDKLSLVTSAGELLTLPKSGLSAEDAEWVDANKEAIGRDGLNKVKMKIAPSAHQLNIIYFVPSNREPIEGYERRLSDLFLHLQQFYGKEMARNGFGPRSFGLTMKSPEDVDILVIKGKKDDKSYPYDGGGGTVIGEVEDYFKTHPAARKSGHTIVIMPTWYDDKTNDENPGGVPFYGMGKICFALDYKDFDLKHIGADTHQGRLLTKWYGGLAHELGHGLNLPHNHATKTDEKNLGTALMGAGNYSFGSKPTFITPASCGILDGCEVFATESKTKHYQGVNEVKVSGGSIKITDDTIAIEGEYACQIPVKSLVVFVEDQPYGVNRDYEALSFLKSLEGKKKGKFSLTIPRDELIGLNDNEFQVRLTFVLSNGNLVRKPFTFYKDNLKDADLKDDPNAKKDAPGTKGRGRGRGSRSAKD